MTLERDKIFIKGWNYRKGQGSYKSLPISKKLDSIGKIDHYAMGTQSAQKKSKNSKSEEEK